jgi:hypothetical protein
LGETGDEVDMRYTCGNPKYISTRWFRSVSGRKRNAFVQRVVFSHFKFSLVPSAKTEVEGETCDLRTSTANT